jgi:sugar lactone lactonase YvrE
MITLPALFEEANNKAEKQRDVLVLIEDETLTDKKDSEADWTANTNASDVDYLSSSGDVQLDFPLWICDTNDKIYNVSSDGSLISSFATSAFDAAALNVTGVSYDTDGTLWICDSLTDKIYNVTTTGTWISEFLATVYDAAAVNPSGVSHASDDTLWISHAQKIYNVQTNGTLISSFATSVFDVSAVNVKGVSHYSPDDTLWVCDSTTDKVYNVETDGTLISSFDNEGYSSASTDINDINAASNNTLWISDTGTDEIYNIGKNGALISSFPTSDYDVTSQNPSGISSSFYSRSGTITTNNFDIGAVPTVAGEWVIEDVKTPTVTYWTCDDNTDKIYNIASDGTLLGSFATSVYDAAAVAPKGIAFSPNGTLWVCDVVTDKIYNIELVGTLISSFATSVFDAAAIFPSGISYATDDTLWVCDQASNKIYNIELDGTLISSFATSVFDAGATGIDGIAYAPNGTLWVCDIATDKIYNIQTDGTLITSFATSVYDAAALAPSAISYASDDTLWVGDDATNKIYNIQTNGTLISSFATSVYDASATGSPGISQGLNNTILYDAWHSTTGAFAGEEVYIGNIADGDAITDLKRYWRVRATLIADADRTETPILQLVKAEFTTFKRFNTVHDLGYEPLVMSVSSLTSKVDFFQAASIGQISISIAMTSAISDWIYTDTLFNKIVKVKLGFNYPGFTEDDYIFYFTGGIDDWNVNDGVLEITLKDLSKDWKLPVPSKWESASDDVVFQAKHHIDVILDIFQNNINVRDSGLLLDSFATVKAATSTYKVTRTITDQSEDAKKLVEELRVLLFAFFLPRGDGRIKIKQFDSAEASVVTFTDDNTLSIKWQANSKDLINRTNIYFDWDGDGEKESDFLDYDGGDDTASQTKFQEIRPFILKDKWTRTEEAAQISALETKILAQFDDMPPMVTITCDAKDIEYEAGDMASVTTLEAPGSSGGGIANEKYLLISKNLDFLGDKIVFKGLKVA